MRDPFFIPGMLFRSALFVVAILCIQRKITYPLLSKSIVGSFFLNSLRSKIPNLNLIQKTLLFIMISILWILSPGLIIFFMLVLTTYFYLGKKNNPFLTKLFAYNLAIRIFIALFILNLAMTFNNVEIADLHKGPAIPLFGDAAYYLIRGFFMAKYHWGTLTNYVRMAEWHVYGDTFYIHLIGWIYYFFGYCPEVITLLNCWVGALLPLVIYQISIQLMPPAPARYAAILTSIFPSLFILSVLTLKDLWFIFFLYLIFLYLLKLVKSFNPFFVIPLFISIFFASVFRQEFSPILLTGLTLLSFFTALPVQRHRKWLALGIACSLLVLVKPFIVFQLQTSIQSHLKIFYSKHVSYNMSGGQSYKILPTNYYANKGNFDFDKEVIPFKSHIAIFSTGVFHLFFQPNLLKKWTFKTILFVPQVLLWYFLFGCTCLGLYDFLNHRFRFSFFLFFLPIILGLAIGSGNVGTLIRHREMLTPFMIILGVFGYYKIQMHIR
ncbi:MAG: hypothetical protein HY390_02450 [Deltaproteobacteria bacterium]|nr:hypothetical protein [Deltaproteobacteria bacterium]